MSRAVIYETFGGPEVLELREVPEPHAGPGEVRRGGVRVRVTAAGLNPMDWGIASRPESAARFGITVPAGFGSDLAGVIDETGETGDGVTGFAVGDRVRHRSAPTRSLSGCAPPRPTRWTSGSAPAA